MALLQDGFRSLARNLPAVLLGIALIFAASLAYFAGQVRVLREIAPEKPAPAKADAPVEISAAPAMPNTAELTAAPEPNPPADLPNWVRGVNVFSEACFAAAAAAIYAIVFSLIGRAMDRPIWKCGVPGEAMERFFVPWFIVTLAPMVLRDFQMQLDTLEAYELAESFLLLVGLFVVPVGACVMFHGALVWHELGQTLGVVTRQFRLFLPVLLVGLMQYILQDMASHALRGLARGGNYQFAFAAAGTTAGFFVFDLLAFAMVWRVCMLDRDTAHHHLDDLIDD